MIKHSSTEKKTNVVENQEERRGRRKEEYTKPKNQGVD
jgi:hypothetical protein